MTTITITRTDTTQGGEILEGTIALSGNYGVANGHGDPMDLSIFDQIKSSGPVAGPMQISEAPPAGTAPTGYLFIFCPGSTLQNGKLSIFNNVTEYTQGSAYSAGLLAAVLSFRAFFPSLV